MHGPESRHDTAGPSEERRAVQYHFFFVRITHWIFAVAFLFLVFSSLPILIAHPRFYWGETGAIGGNALFSLHLPFWTGLSGWGRNMHFLFAWVSLFTGVIYVFFGIRSQHFRKNLLPKRHDLVPRTLLGVVVEHLRPNRTLWRHSLRYNVIQRIAYLAVVFILFPMAFLSGLAMSPAITSVVPGLVTFFGGHQSARTIHFLLAVFLVAFLAVHLLMIFRAGFFLSTKAMITGQYPIEEPANLSVSELAERAVDA